MDGCALMPELKKIVRFMDTDIDGDLQIGRALRKISGIGFVFSRISCMKAGIDEKSKTGALSSEELKRLQENIVNPSVPSFLLNRRKDLDTGNDIHVTRINLELKRRDDINLMKRIKAYKGIRHELGLPVRGQRTRSSFRTNITVGVSKKAVKEAKAVKPAAKPGAKPAAK